MLVDEISAQLFATVDQVVAFVDTYSTRAIAGLIVFGIFWLLFRLTRTPLRRLLKRTEMGEALSVLLVDNIYRLTLYAIGLLSAMHQFGVNIVAALAGAGIVGLALSFAAQDSLTNIISGFMIFWDKPFKIGDWVSVAGNYGKVSEITMRSTRIRTLENTYVVVPNRIIIDTILVNHSKQGQLCIVVRATIAYKEDTEAARKAILGAVEVLPGVMKGSESKVVVDALTDSGANLLVRVWIENAEDEKPMHWAVAEATKKTLNEAGIEISYPHRKLIVEPGVLKRALE